MTLWRWIVLIIVGAAVFIGVSMTKKDLGDGLTACIFAVTFVAILSYTIETRRLVDLQKRAAEFERRPWLKARQPAAGECLGTE